jgi:hypothetical protein
VSVLSPHPALEAIAESLALFLPERFIERSLIDPAGEPAERLAAGVVCLVCGGGGDFANYRGREGDLGQMEASLVGFLQVPEDSKPKAIEAAELALLHDLLRWTNERGSIAPADSALPMDFTLSQQLEHPYGWVRLRLEVRF